MEQNPFMMAGGMPPQGMQRPQAGNENDQIHAKIMEELRKTAVPQGVWQSTMDPRERASWIMQIQTGMRLIQPQNPNIMHAIAMAMKFEHSVFVGSPSKDQYTALIRQKMTDFQKHRQAMNSGMLQAQQQQQQHQQQQQQQQQQNNLPMQQQGMGMPNVMQTPMQPSRSNQGELPNNVPQLQQPFQPSPMNMPVQNTNMQANMTQQQQRQRQINPQEKTLIENQARALMSQLPKHQADLIRRQIVEKMPPEQRQHLQQSGQDPLPRHMFTMAMNRYLQNKAQQQQQQQQQGNPQNISMDGNAALQMNMQRPSSQQSMMPGQNIDFASFAGQQADALKMQESGQLVVPASTAGNATNQNNANNNNNANSMDPAALNMANMGQPNMTQPGMMNNQAQAQVQSMLAVRQQQLQRDAAMRNNQMQTQAQAQARNAAQAAAQQQGMLRGQPGGLNATQPPHQSPAMSMLNRPMVPPGQPGGATPQQRPQQMQQPNGQINPQMMAQMQQQQQNMNANTSMFPPQNGVMPIPDNLPPNLRERLMALPEDQRRVAIEKIRANMLQQQHNQQAAQAQNPANVPTADNMNQMQNLQNGMQPNMTNMQGLNSAQVQQKLMQQQQAQQRMRMLDGMSLPRKTLDELQIQPPANVQTWGQLKQFVHDHVSQQQPDVLRRVQALQAAFVKQQQQNSINANGLQRNTGQMPGVAPPAQAPMPQMMPNTQAPPAQMVPPQQPPPNMGQPNLNMPMNQPNMPINPSMVTITPQEMQSFRAKMGTSNATDEQIRNAIIKFKINKMQAENPAAMQQHRAQQQAQQQALRQAQLQRGNMAQMQQPQPQPGMAPQAPGMQQRVQQPVGMGAGAPNMQGQKRPGTSDDVVEIPNPNQSPQRPPTANAQMNQPLQRLGHDAIRNMTPEQLSKIPAEQRAQLLQMQQTISQRSQADQNQRLLAQQQQNQGRPQQPQQSSPPSQPVTQPPTVTQQDKAQAHQMAMATDKQLKKAGPVQCNEQTLNEMVVKLKSMLPLVLQVEKMLPLSVTLASAGLIPSQTVQKICYLRTSFFHQMNRQGHVDQYISLDLDKIEELNVGLKRAYTYIGHQMKQLQSQGQNQQNKPGQVRPTPVQQRTEPTSQPQQPPALQHRPASITLQRQESQGAQARPKNKAPPAPTASAPPFPLGAPSPHGVPVYENLNNSLTPDKLQLPPQKRRKGNNGSAASTPANQATPGSGASPQLKMHPSPDHKRNLQAKLEQQQQQDRRFKCSDEYCEFSIRGFEKEDELQAHVAEAHKKIDNPLDFFLNSAASALEVDADGNAKTPKADSNAANRGKQHGLTAKQQAHLGPATIKREALKVEGQTPGKGKLGVATPSPNFAKPSSPASGRTTQAKQAQKGQSEQAPARSKTMLETMAEKAGITLPKPDESIPMPEVTVQKPVSTSPVVVGEDATGKDTSLSFMNSMSEALSGLDGVAYGEYDMDYMFSDPSPALTPSSSQSGVTDATTNSNVSQNDRLKMSFAWDPWNMGSGLEMDYGQGIGLQEMGLQSMFDKPEENKEGGDSKTKTEELPFSWDNIFHAGAGLDKNENDWDKDAFGNSVFAGAEFFEVA